MSAIFNDIVKNISSIITFDSSQSAPSEGAPFGEGAKKALDYFLALAEHLGFETVNYDGYAGEASFGKGEEFAVLAHLDVVPAGGGWTHDPFGGEIDYERGRIWGRGAMDDKGPAIIALFAMKALADEGFKPRRKIKLIVGCNEENGWECIEYYKTHAHMPDEGFSPDADFPVIYAEKGILHIKLTFPVNGDYSSLKGGERANMVCDYCEAEAPMKSDFVQTESLEYRDGKIISHGKSAHGSTPEHGVNAIPPVLSYIGLADEITLPLLSVADKLCSFEDETGKLTFSPNVIKGGDGFVEIVCDIRYPATAKKEDVLKVIEDGGIKYDILHEQSPLFNEKDGNLVKTLCEVYNEVTGKNAVPVAIGGGTYARALKNGAAFGPEEEGDENTVHQANEYISFEKIQTCFKIYKLALKKLTC